MNPPQSRPPVVPTSGGNGKYVAVALLLLLGTGFLVMRNRSAQMDAPAPVAALPSASASAAPENPKLDDIPPPPPEEKPEPKPTGPRIVYVNANAGCDGKCSGKLSAELNGALTVRGQQARRCYNQALAQDSTLKGHVQIGVRVGPGGNVCSANVTGNDMGTASVGNCAANIFRQAALPAPQGGCVDVSVPLSFVPQGG
ncbi:MAG: AgmX/PglI C-terminal domain-containing protein [Polyangiaceae bacterium]